MCKCKILLTLNLNCKLTALVRSICSECNKNNGSINSMIDMNVNKNFQMIKYSEKKNDSKYTF